MAVTSSVHNCVTERTSCRASRGNPAVRKSPLKLAPRLLLSWDMSVLRTMSLIVGGALVALGGTAVAFFL